MPYIDPEKRRASVRKHYAANPDYYRKRNRALRAENVAKVRAAKAVPCADCGERFPYYVMDLDHRPGEDKRFELGGASSRGRTRKQIAEELAKCDVVCANCHRVRTFTRASQ